MANFTTTNPTSLPPCRRYICTHDSSGKSIMHSSPDQLYLRHEDMGGVARSYATGSVPAILKDDQDVERYMDTNAAENPLSHKAMDIVIRKTDSSPNGSNLVIVDLIPGGESVMHRTVSIDYSICVLGSIDMELDSGERVNLKPGDHIIQRGTMHKWYNASKTEPARFVAVTLPCEPFEIAGKMLEEDFKGPGSVQSDGSKM